MKDIKALRVSLHDAVLDSVVDHLYERPRSGWAAINIAVFGGSGQLLASRGAGNVAPAGGKRLENWIKLPNDLLRPADHHAVTAFEAPNTTTGTDIHVMNAFVFVLL